MRRLKLILTFISVFTVLVVYSQEEIDFIVLDPGHGGKDIGCSTSKHFEKDLTLELCYYIQQYLKVTNPDLRVQLTRNSDVFIPLHERIGMANELRADLFISVHCNSFHQYGIHGSETYVLGIKHDDELLDIAKRENASIAFEEMQSNAYARFDLNTPEAYILLSNYQQNFLNQSINLANKLQLSLSKNTSLKNRGVKQAGFLVLKGATMPAILFEAGFVSDSLDLAFISSKSGQKKIAKSFSIAINQYLKEFDQINSATFVLESTPSKEIGADSVNTLENLLTEASYDIKIQLLTSLNKPLSQSDPAWKIFPGLMEQRTHQVYNYLTGNYVDI